MEQLVIVAVDHSLQAQNAVKYYLNKLHRTGNRLILVHCIELPSINEARECTMSPGVLANLWKEEETRTKQLEDNMKALLRDKGISAKLRNVRGRPGEMLCGIANEEGAALVVVGSRGMGNLRKALLGSVSDHIIKHSPCPVVVCRDPLDLDDPTRNRHSSDQRNRSFSGDGGNSIASQFRRRFASGSRSVASTSVHLPEEVRCEVARLERTVVLCA